MKIEELKKGQTLLTTCRKVGGGKFQIEIAEFVENPNAGVNVAALLNKGDKRFTESSSKPRRAWQSGTPEGLKEAFGIDVSKLQFKKVGDQEIAEIGKLNPEIAGCRLQVQLKDSMTPTFEGQKPKQVKDKDGNVLYFMKGGAHIYQSTSIVAGVVKHTIIDSDERVPASAVVTTSSSSAINA